MKSLNILVIIFSLGFQSLTFGQNWNRVLNGENLFCIKWLNNNIGFVGGSNGLILKTTNGGIDWEAQNTGILSSAVNCDFISISIVNDNIMYASTDGMNTTGYQLYKSTDGGATWSRVANPTYYGAFRAIHFFDVNNGIAVGSNGSQAAIFKTTDGGVTWSTKLTDSGHLMFTSVCFPSASVGYAVGDRVETSTNPGMIYKTTDGGNTWTKNYTPAIENYSQVMFLNENTGFVVGGKNALKVGEYLKVSIKKTTNGGQSWTDVVSGNGNILKSIDFMDANNGIALGHGDTNNGEIYKSTNGGNNWTKVVWNYPESGISYYKLSVISHQNNKFWIVGNNGLIMNADVSGLSWNTVANGSIDDINSICFPSDDIGYVTTNRHLLKSTNGGKNWFQAKQLSINNVFFMNTTTGFGATNTGIFKTTDGGKTWTSKSSNSIFYSVYFPNETTGYAGASQGGIYKTTNGGETWTKLANNYLITQDVRSIWFYNADIGYILQKNTTSSSGKVMKTADGGTTWTQQSVGGLGFCFFDANNGIIAGTSGGINVTVNGGQNWTSKYTGVGSSIDLYNLAFMDKNTGFAVGESGTIIKTTDGCETWKKETAITANNLTTAALQPSKSILAGGLKGNLVIYKNESLSASPSIRQLNQYLSLTPTIAHTQISVRNSGNPLTATLQFINTNGQIVKKVNAVGFNTTISVSDLPCGIYMIQDIKTKEYIKFLKK
jgi:photosystem II stability/assembly factor-like uncharacterized protein